MYKDISSKSMHPMFVGSLVRLIVAKSFKDIPLHLNVTGNKISIKITVTQKFPLG